MHQTDYAEARGVPRFLLRVDHAELDGPLELELSPGQRRFVPGLEGTEIAMSDARPLRWTLSRPGEPVRRFGFRLHNVFKYSFAFCKSGIITSIGTHYTGQR